MEIVENLALMGHRVQKEYRVQMGSQDLLDHLGLQGMLEAKDHLVLVEHEVLPVYLGVLVTLVPLVPEVHKVQMVLQDQMDPRVSGDRRVCQGIRELLENLVNQA